MHLVNYNNTHLQERSLLLEPITLPKLNDTDLIDKHDTISVTEAPPVSVDLMTFGVCLFLGSLAASIFAILTVAIGGMAVITMFTNILMIFSAIGYSIGFLIYSFFWEDILEGGGIGIFNRLPKYMINKFFSHPIRPKRSINNNPEIDISPKILEMIKKELESPDQPLNVSIYEKKNHTIIEGKYKQNSSLISSLFGNNIQDSELPLSIYFHFKSEDINMQNINSTTDKNLEDLQDIDELFLTNFFNEHTNSYNIIDSNTASMCMQIPVSKEKSIPAQIDISELQEDNSCL